MKDEVFFEVVRTMPFVEADQELRARKQHAMVRRAEFLRRGDTIANAENDALLTRLNDELHRLNRINRDYQMQQAIKVLFGADGWERVKVWLMENKPETM